MIVACFLSLTSLKKKTRLGLDFFFFSFEFCFLGCFEVFMWLRDMFSNENMLENGLSTLKTSPFIFIA